MYKTTDSLFTNEVKQLAMENICSVFGCNLNEIEDIVPMQAGMTNIVFAFKLNGGKYIYRHPGIGSDTLVDRGRETIMQAVVTQAGIDSTLVAMDVEDGWRISRYVDHKPFDYHNLNDMVRAIMLIHQLHQVPSKVRWNFDVMVIAEKIKDEIEPEFYGNYQDFEGIRERCYKLNELAKYDGIKQCYIHGDARDVNFLINKDEIHLIDWEYGGYGDPGFDIGSYVCGGEHTRDDIERILFTYFRRQPTSYQRRHFYAYIAITGWFYMHWTMLKESKGQQIGINKDLWYQYALEYSKLALTMYMEDNK